MNYLSDQILFNIPTSGQQYINYVMNIIPPYWYTSNTFSDVYTGRVFAYKEGQKLYANDILSSYADNYSWMGYDRVYTLNNDRDTSSLINAIVRDEPRTFANVQVSMNDEVETKFVNLFYRDSKNPCQKTIGTYWFTKSTPDSLNMLELRSSIIPRIPRLNVADSQFFVGGLFAVTAGWRNYSEVDGDGIFRIVILDEDKRIVEGDKDDINFVSYDLTSPVTSILFNGFIIDGDSPGGFSNQNYANHYLAVAPAHYENDELVPEDTTSPVILGQFDECNADYYLIWCDRTGGYQCQRFNEKTTLTEDITTTNITNMIGEERPLMKSVRDVYDLKSDWLSFEEYKAFESIFTSPYLYLYDVKHNELTPVVCNEKRWVEKTSSNTNKPFNLQIKVSANRTQNILY